MEVGLEYLDQRRGLDEAADLRDVALLQGVEGLRDCWSRRACACL